MKSLNGRRTSDRNLASCLRETIEAIGSAVANVVCVLNPHAVIVSGRYALFGDYFVKRLQAATERRLIDNLKRDLLFLPSSYGETGPLVGAAAMVRDYWLDHFSESATESEIQGEQRKEA